MNKTYLLYGVTSLVFLIFSFLVDGSFDIANHDTYLSIANSHLCLSMSFLFAIYFLISLAFYRKEKPINRSLTFLHWVLSLVGIISLIIIIQKMYIDTPQHYYDFNVYTPNQEIIS